MPASETKFHKSKDGTIAICHTGSTFYIKVTEKDMTKQQQFEAIRWSILANGDVFTEKLEKKVRKLLNVENVVWM
jgi:predicted oxidoreductase